MLIYGHEIRPGDILVTKVWVNGNEVAEVDITEDNSVRVQYVTGATEWFTTQGIVTKREFN